MDLHQVTITCKVCRFPQAVVLDGEGGHWQCGRCGDELCVHSILRGYVYVLGNDHLPGLVKIGYTERPLRERLAELSNSAVPSAFRLVAAFACEDPEADEKRVHELLSDVRESHDREFFRLPEDTAAVRVAEILERAPVAQKAS